MPRSYGLMRPSALTAVASVITSAAPPTAREARCTRCQSLAKPSMLEYSHIGDTTMRWGRVRPREVKGSNSEAISDLRFVIWNPESRVPESRGRRRFALARPNGFCTERSRRRHRQRAIPAQLRCRGGDSGNREHTSDPSANDRKRRSQPVRNGACFQLTELRAADEEDHVHADHAASQSIRRFDLANDVANHHADGVGDACERERRERDPETS